MLAISVGTLVGAVTGTLVLVWFVACSEPLNLDSLTATAAEPPREVDIFARSSRRELNVEVRGAVATKLSPSTSPNAAARADYHERRARICA
jgi:hypothetical protein